MNSPGDYDPDDNFGHAFHDGADLDEDAALEAVAWQFLLLINPGDEDSALQQFAAIREALASGDDPVQAIREAIDWKAGFWLADDDTTGVIEAIDELASRFDLRIDWGTDPTDDEFLADVDVPTLLGIAYDRLREHHYTLWTWETGEQKVGGWITLQRDEEGFPQIANALGFHARAGAG